MRAELSPFHVAVMKALSFELENYSLASIGQIKRLSKPILDEIIQNVPEEAEKSIFGSFWRWLGFGPSASSSTLQLELGELQSNIK